MLHRAHLFLLVASAACFSRTVPDFMLDLLHSQRPVADVVRSLNPQKIVTAQSEKSQRKEIQSLHFTIPERVPGELFQDAQLRIYATLHNRRRTLYGVERLLQVTLRSPEQTSMEVEAHPTTLMQLYLKRNTWLSVNISSSFKTWRLLGRKELHVHVHVLNPYTNVGGGGDLEFNLDDGQKLEPTLLLFYDLETPPAAPEAAADGHNVSKRSVPFVDLKELEDYEEESNNIWDEDFGVRAASALHTTSTTTTPEPRAASSGKKANKNPCRRKPMYVDFAEIQYDRWIIAPDGYEAYQCVGKCIYPIGDHLTPSKHSIVQALVHTNSPRRAQKPCCVPTKLKPISMLYVDHNGVLTYRLSYEDMVVAECGCR